MKESKSKFAMAKLRKYLDAYCEKRKLKSLRKTFDALRSLRHTDDDLLDAKERAVLDMVLEEGASMQKASSEEERLRWQEQANLLWKKHNPHAGMREALDVLAVALMVAFGIRALFFQPFQIPTSSMQPTLFGIHFVDTEKARSLDAVPKLYGKWGTVGNYLFFAAQRAVLDVKTPGWVGSQLLPAKQFGLWDAAQLSVGNQSYVLPGEPGKVAEYTELYPNKYLSGKVVDGFLSAGDHLFVDRLSIHWREPERGDIMVFSTEGIRGPAGEMPSTSGGYYIKRLMGLPGDTLKIENQTLYVKPSGQNEFKPIYELAPVTKKLYSGLGGYQGHSNLIPGVSHFLRSASEEYVVPEGYYFMLGDNTRFSADSRVWGPVPRRNLVGRPAVIFWPFSRRWGAPDTREPLQVPTGEPGMRTFKTMYLQ